MLGKILTVDYAALSPKVSVLTDKYKIEVRGEDEFECATRYNLYGARFSTDPYRHQPLSSISLLSENKFGLITNRQKDEEIEVTDWRISDIEDLLDKKYPYKDAVPFDGEILKIEIICKSVVFNIDKVSQILKFDQNKDLPLLLTIKIL